MSIEETKKKSRGNYLELLRSKLRMSKQPFVRAAPPEVGFSASPRIQHHLLAMEFAQLLGRVGGTKGFRGKTAPEICISNCFGVNGN